jgi:hypothetical protein
MSRERETRISRAVSAARIGSERNRPNAGSYRLKASARWSPASLLQSGMISVRLLPSHSAPALLQVQSSAQRTAEFILGSTVPTRTLGLPGKPAL